MRNPYPKFVWFLGFVEDTSSDPMRLGRVRVRAVGFHPSSAKTTDLPYASVLDGGSVRISNGQMVLGFFMDGEEAQQPYVLGTISGAVTGSDFIDNLRRAGIAIRGVFQDIVENISEAVEGIFPDPSPASVDKEFWTLVAICARENIYKDFQGCADVAQSIYNRVAAGEKVGYLGPDTISGKVLYPGQYQPVFGRRALYNAIKDVKTAAAATGLNESYLIEVARSIQNPNLQAAAAGFVKGRTDFLAQTQPARVMTENRTKVIRFGTGFKGNQFGFSNRYVPKPIPPATPVPAFINNYKIEGN